MKIYTAPIMLHRAAQRRKIPFYDITVKSGDKMFAPTWEILMEYKNGGNKQLYTVRFMELMRERYRQNKQYWLDFLQQDQVCIACYCASGNFCHRHIMVDIFEKICNHHNIEFERGGEL